jgi:hypothetical protein
MGRVWIVRKPRSELVLPRKLNVSCVNLFDEPIEGAVLIGLALATTVFSLPSP